MSVFSPTKLGQQIERLKQRTGRNWSLREIAKEASVSQAYLILLKNGQRKNPSMDIVYKLSRFFQVPPEDLLELDGQEVSYDDQMTEKDHGDIPKNNQVVQTLQICEQLVSTNNAKQALGLLDVLIESELPMTTSLLMEIQLTKVSALIAIKDFEKSEKILSEIQGKDVSLYYKAKCKYMRGKLLYELDKYQQAIQEILQAKEMAEDAESSDLLYLIHYALGVCYKETGEYSSSIFNYENALQIFPASKTPLAKAHLLMGIGLTHLRLLSIQAAMEAFLQARSIYEESGEKKFIADIQHNIARVEFLQGNYEHAIQQLQTSLELHQAVGDYLGIAYDLLEMSLTYKEMKQWDRVEDYATRANFTFQTVNKKGHAARAQILILESKLSTGVVCENQLATLENICGVYEELDWPFDLARALRLKADLIKDKGDQEQALMLCFQALDLYESRVQFAKIKE